MKINLQALQEEGASPLPESWLLTICQHTAGMNCSDNICIQEFS